MPGNRHTIHLTIIIEKADLPSSRIRFVQAKPLLESLGAEVELIEYPKSRRKLLSMLWQLKSADLVILQKRLPNPLESLLFKLFTRKLVYDFDDAVRFRHLSRNGSYRSRSREVRFDAMIACANAVVCGNEYLAGMVRKKRPIHIYPSPVPTDVPKRNYNDLQKRVKLGWVGLGSNLNSLERIVPALQRLSAETAIELVIISDQGLEIDGVAVVHHVWSLEEQERWISSLDIGLMPLDSESPFDRGKCSYKLLQYMASGVVPVADAVGMNEVVIKDGENGRLVYNNDWYPVLRDLVMSDHEKKAEMGQKARDLIMREYGYQGQADKLYGFLYQVVTGDSHV